MTKNGWQKPWVRIVTTVLTLAVMVMIFCFSMENAEKSDRRSGVLSGSVIRLLCPEYDTLDGVYALAADVDQDGSITVADATCIQMYLAEFTGGCGSCGEYIEAA